MSAYEPDWERARDDVVSTLQSLLRIDTTNPPGNETVAAEWIAARLSDAGYAPTILESAPGRGTVVARLEGSGAAEPLLLMSHTDVVPAEPEQWDVPPFSGEIRDGYIWGRGALDMKHIVAQHLILMLLFKRLSDQGLRLERDLIFMAAADEERSGHFGAQWMVANHPELIRAEYALNEGGGTSVRFGESILMTVQTAEKGLARFRLIARGTPGHASVPRQDSAVLALAEAVLAIGRARLPVHLTETARAFFETLAGTMSDEARRLITTMLENPEMIDEIVPQLPIPELRKRYLLSMTHNTASPTILSAGSKVNVFPSEAVARVDGRTLPGFDNAAFRAELEPHLPEGIELEFEEEGAALEAPLESPLYHAIVAAVEAHAPDVTLVPVLLSGATDAKAIVKLGTKVIGFSPQRYEPELEGLELVHGHNERISVENLFFGLRVLYDVIWRFCGPRAD